MRRSIVLLLLALAILLAGCKPNRPQPTAGKIAKSVVSLSPSTTELVASFSRDPLLVGHTAYDNFPRTIKGEIVATTKPDYEKIAALKPDLIVYDAALYGSQDVDKLKSAVPNALIMAIDANTLEQFISELYQLGSYLHSETEINDYVDRILSEKAAATAAPYNPVPKVAIVMPGASSPDYISGSGSFLADVVRAAGGTPVGPNVAKFVQITPEALVALNPDVIVVPGSKSNVKGALQILQNPRYKTLKAVQSGRVRVVDQDVLLRRGSRVEQLIKGLHAAFAPK